VRAAFDRLLRDLTLTTLALAIALGWALFQVAEGIAELAAGLLYEIDADQEARGISGFFYPTRYTGVLVWNVGGRLLTFGHLVVGLIELAVVLVVAVFIYRRRVVSSEDA